MVSQNNGSFQNLNPKQLADRAIRQCPHAIVNFGDLSTSCLIDTGAEVSVIAEKYFVKHLNKNIVDIQGWLRIKTATRSDMPYVGYTELDISVAGISFQNMAFLVVKDLQSGAIDGENANFTPVTIGCNILHRMHDVLFDKYGSNFLSKLDTDSSENRWLSVLSMFDDAAMNNTGTDGHIGFLKSSKNQMVRIPANSVKRLSATANKLSGYYTALVERTDNSEGSLPNNILLVRGFTSVQYGKMSVQVANITNDDIWIPPKAGLGKLQAAKQVNLDLENDCPVRHSKGGELVIGQVNSSIVENDDVDFWPLGLEADLSYLDSAQQNAVNKLVSQHCKVFACGDELGYTDLIKHTIPTTDDRPVRLPHRRILPNLQPEVKEHLQKWVKQGVI